MNPRTSFPSILAISLAMVLLASCPSIPRAQCGGCEPEGGIEPGAWALQFRVADNFTLDGFKGSIVSAKYHFTKSRAVRLGVSGSLTAVDEGGSERDTAADSVFYEDSSSGKHRSRSVGINAEYLHYYAPQGRINAFIGAGPLFSYNWGSDYRHSPQNGDRDSHSHGWALGASTLVGVEWFAARSISLHGEYGLALTRSWSNSEDVNTNYSPARTYRRENSDHRWNFSGSIVQLGLSVYL